MPKAVTPTRERGERNIDLDIYRVLPYWGIPVSFDGNIWRQVVRNQPTAIICRDTLISYVEALDWRIEARDSTMMDELKPEIDYYTKLLTDDGNLEFSTHLEWIGQDLLDTPFGGASEVGRDGDKPGGKVMWIEPLDGATLYPTLNTNYPVVQQVNASVIPPVQFPYWAIDRVMWTPIPKIDMKGWTLTPPMKIYMALELLNRGDVYYANLLLDTPEAGILDLADMERETAEQWIGSFRDLMKGINPFKIPVLYEHTQPINWIPFNRPPTDLMYDRITLKFSALVCAGYGMTLADIGMPSSTNGGDTMAGTIRQERKSRKSGHAMMKKKLQAYFNRMLPEALSFVWIDYDDELNVALGRARLSNATAFGQMIDKRYLTPKEARLQMIKDGMVTVPIPEEIPEEELPEVQSNPTGIERPGMLGSPVSPSQGGYGETKSDVEVDKAIPFESVLWRSWKTQLDGISSRATDVRIRKMVRKVAKALYQEFSVAVNKMDAEELSEWKSLSDKILWDQIDGYEEVRRANDNYFGLLEEPLEEDQWWKSEPSEDELVAALAAAYMSGVRSSAFEIAEDLYEHGYVSTPYLASELPFVLSNSEVMRFLERRALDMVRNVNDGTKYYIKRTLLSGLRNTLSTPEIIAKIRAGVDIDTILNDNKFMQIVSELVKSEIADLSDIRVKSIVTYELGQAENYARLEQFSKIGLTQKAWKHVGADTPCILCIENESAGFVPLDYEYRGVFGPTKTGPAHPHEHCGLMYDKNELHKLYSKNRFQIWTGD